MDIQKSDYHYELPVNSIAKHAVEPRDSSKLLVYKEGDVKDLHFRDLPGLLRHGDLLVCNNAKVIPARLHFYRRSGARIELLLLRPIDPLNYDQNFNSTKEVIWECMIGNLRKWKDSEVISLDLPSGSMEAELLDRNRRLVRLCWPEGRFSEVLETIGELPIPPYLGREVEADDRLQYQTVYARKEGSVAAPTAGLHFTDAIFKELKAAGVGLTQLTLHVGAGTFLPVKEDNVVNHPMHNERFSISTSSIEQLLQAPRRIAVGTTSLRVLESLYYLGLRAKQGKDLQKVEKLEPYQVDSELSYKASLQLLLDYLNAKGQQYLDSSTEIMILPQYRLRSIAALVTNFHLPESTLLMLIASAVGENWREIYQHALEKDYRFLSYGDSSLLFV